MKKSILFGVIALSAALFSCGKQVVEKPENIAAKQYTGTVTFDQSSVTMFDTMSVVVPVTRTIPDSELSGLSITANENLVLTSLDFPRVSIGSPVWNINNSGVFQSTVTITSTCGSRPTAKTFTGQLYITVQNQMVHSIPVTLTCPKKA